MDSVTHPEVPPSSEDLLFHWVVALSGSRNIGWFHSGAFLCEHTCPFTSKRPPRRGSLEDARVCCLAFWGTSPGPLLMSLFPPSGNSSKKPTREWEPLSEAKVNACLPACAITSPPLGSGGGQLQSKHVGISSRQDVPSAGAAVPGSLRASGFPARGIQGLGSQSVSCMRAGLRCMALHPECL